MDWIGWMDDRTILSGHVTRGGTVMQSYRDTIPRHRTGAAPLSAPDLHLYGAICFICFSCRDPRYDLYGMDTEIRIKANSALLRRLNIAVQILCKAHWSIQLAKNFVSSRNICNPLPLCFYTLSGWRWW